MNTCPLLIYFDGSFAKRTAVWAFSVFTCNGDLLFSRWGRVCIDPESIHYLGAESHTNNTGELTTFGETLIWLITECTHVWKQRGVVFAYDSTYSIGAGTAEWKTTDNLELAETVSFFWEVFDIDQSPIFGMKVKSHTENPYNDHVDIRAKWGAGVAPVTPCDTPRTIGTETARATRNRKLMNESPAHARPKEPMSMAGKTVDGIYESIVEAAKTIMEHMRSNLPSKPPLRPYITTTCLHLLAERDLCWKRIDTMIWTG